MPLDPSAVGASAEPYRATWGGRDALLYALCIGAGVNELAYTTENTQGLKQQVFPTFALVAGHGPESRLPSFGDFPLTKALHGAQTITLHKPLPVDGDVTIQNTVSAMYDKGKDAVAVLEGVATDNSDGALLFSRRTSLFVRGGGGWGGRRGPSGNRNIPPARDPDHEITYPTSPNQALLYRLTGDRTRLHSDPALATEAGFERPILHGLCTFGFTGRALLHMLCDGISSRFAHMEGRFSSAVLPGEALTVRVWMTEPGQAVFTTAVGDRVVIARGRCQYRT
ncbi:MAG TPA: MaoC/PaaZ C-terminal domain-containing protein [Amycolatopsis sp.]|uniref:MaoC/PaaZ C-terminal domain-containing protein n=1 Tax=Amycolatopsis sp. TaxID=37632 RepID=UPI002B46DF7C|nr:MaoC/PaaZ C-terminal domain-containing protein [Amycolatopsis sp.]HKS46997.1 MaoC/PaaZ C-terminal domain-containing protein [Amycolatopsis sp.]